MPQINIPHKGKDPGQLPAISIVWSRLWDASVNASIDENGKLFSSTGSSENGADADIAITHGKWYWEVLMLSKSVGMAVGLRDPLAADGSWSIVTGIGFWTTSLYWIMPGQSYVTTGQASAQGQVLGFALDMDLKTLSAFVDGAALGAIPWPILPNTLVPCVNDSYGDTGLEQARLIDGSPGFPLSYSVPQGYQPLSAYA